MTAREKAEEIMLNHDVRTNPRRIRSVTSEELIFNSTLCKEIERALIEARREGMEEAAKIAAFVSIEIDGAIGGREHQGLMAARSTILKAIEEAAARLDGGKE